MKTSSQFSYEVTNVEVIWAVKHSSISAAFVDAGAAEFFLPHLNDEKRPEGISKRMKYTVTKSRRESREVSGSALGPDWAHEFDLKGSAPKVRSKTFCFLKKCLMLLSWRKG